MRLAGNASPAANRAARNPLARFGHRLVDQPDDGERDGAAGNLHLNVNGPRLDAGEGHR